MRKYPNVNYIFSIQGIVGVYSRYYKGGISAWEIFRNITFRDIVQRDSIFQGEKRFERRGILEREYFIRSQNVIGRTSWDFVHSKTSNPAITYHFCNESLRDSFYDSAKWDSHKIIPFSIFLSQSVYPIKGLHNVIKALGILRKNYPDIQLRVAGPEILRNKRFLERIRVSGYGKYVGSLIKKYNLNNNIVFTGVLSEEQMVSEYLKAHLFICPSSIENSPNSVGEAQILGVPTIAAYVGGIPDMVVHEESGLLYRFEEFEMLAYNIKRIFEDINLVSRLSENGRKVALKRHDRIKNVIKMVEIYEQVINRK